MSARQAAGCSNEDDDSDLPGKESLEGRIAPGVTTCFRCKKFPATVSARSVHFCNECFLFSVRVRFKTNLNTGMGQYSAGEAKEKRIRADRKQTLRDKTARQGGKADAGGEAGITGSDVHNGAPAGSTVQTGERPLASSSAPNGNEQMGTNAHASSSNDHSPEGSTSSQPRVPLPNILLAIEPSPVSLAFLDLFNDSFADVITPPGDATDETARRRGRPKKIGRVFVVYVDDGSDAERDNANEYSLEDWRRSFVGDEVNSLLEQLSSRYPQLTFLRSSLDDALSPSVAPTFCSQTKAPWDTSSHVKFEKLGHLTRATTSNTEPLHQILTSPPPSLSRTHRTSLALLRRHLRRIALLSLCAHNSASYLVLACTASRISARTLACLAQGRGWSLADDIGEPEIRLEAWCDRSGEAGSVRMLRPLKEITDHEIWSYLKLQGLTAADSTTAPESSPPSSEAGPFSSGASLAHSTLPALSRRLIGTLTAGFPSTATTVSKTAERVAVSEWWLEEKEKGTPHGSRAAGDGCGLCLSPFRSRWLAWNAAHTVDSLPSAPSSDQPLPPPAPGGVQPNMVSSVEQSLEIEPDNVLCHSCYSALLDAAKVVSIQAGTGTVSSGGSSSKTDASFTLPPYSSALILRRLLLDSTKECTDGVVVNTPSEEDERMLREGGTVMSRDALRGEVAEWLIGAD
ncbi:hypothetical protein M427DRAFT_381373 [Gonapodya prolifera JEL478]|uniref:Cytoplasmic tRNA 2-thiolation protein 2 n=1 Tax=Gonapodya prolifera (strain JEL478) TaxID=1344416 RepID=A0A139A929_GONPJ|nr:hypothetical protein M427DRAFT_381373 [Gonapodya prolifera JEL478]|eukprot:KXS13247.1 hypothetical protein M427DRAFT_381373 [Gonapodya prolifera JEL478]